MLTPELQERARTIAQRITTHHKESTANGFDMAAIGLPTFETQADHDEYHPDDAGQPFTDLNEFAEAVSSGLSANGVPSQKVVIHFPEYSAWLNGKANTSEMRSAFAAYLTSKMGNEAHK